MKRAGLGLIAVALAGGVTFDEPVRFAPGTVSTDYSEIRLTISPDGTRALWFSRNRPGGPGGYDIWMSRRTGDTWSPPESVPFNSAGRDFDPAFTADGRYVYFCSDRPGGPGGDDLYRVRVMSRGFGPVEPLGAEVNSARNEWAPMVSPDGRTLLFSSDGFAGAGGMDLFTAKRVGKRFAPAQPLAGALNSEEDEFDATFLADGSTLVFSRARNLRKDTVTLHVAAPSSAGYEHGTPLPVGVNTPGSDTYAPMLDWSQRKRLTFTRDGDVYLVDYTVR